ncbi:hypothetical protein BB559_003988 [Furculomyces boomerangus]|uniref:Homoserine dehydrogenase n=2 Tax=Harpellales TaxID=61421 RepID=A0A2T9YHC8_9FUNG|nr:hypothetical protein BB559_003988 [Furculomyces boomerangus]PWA02263.1 hypothetical protein BB558_001603 [Smittium angustum]
MLSVAIVGPGLVGEALIKMIHDYSQSLRAITVPIQLVAITNSRKMIFGDSSPINPNEWKSIISSDKAQPADIPAFIKQLAQKHVPGKTAIIDCTSNESIANNYLEWLNLGFNVITPNKKAFSGSIDLWNQLRAFRTKQGAPLILHEATVGAGLPVLSTLNNLVDSGDKIIKVEGILSGTLSFLFCEFSNGTLNGKPFSEIVKIAKANGFTEPDPRDDLSGLDVARKATILARISGANIELDQLALENIVPEPLRPTPTADEFMSKLPEFDDHFSALNKAAYEKGEVLRYVASIDIENKDYRVELKSFPKSHPFASLSPGDNIISFKTKYFPNPLTIQGAGAGAEVTSFGIFCDILKTAEVSK